MISVVRSFGRSVGRSGHEFTGLVMAVGHTLAQMSARWSWFLIRQIRFFCARWRRVSLIRSFLLPMAPHHEKNSRTPIPTRFGFRLWGGIDCSCLRCCFRKLLASIGLGNQDHSKVTFELSSSTILPDNAVVVVGFQGQGPCDGDVIAVCLHAYH